MEAFTWSFELPERAEDAPPPSGKAVRRIEAPDGEHWFEVKGGGAQVETAYVRHIFNQLAQAGKAFRDKQISEDELKAATEAGNAALATFIADRVVDHNLTDHDGNKLPLGMALYFELDGTNSSGLIGAINRRANVWENPKAGTPSTNG